MAKRVGAAVLIVGVVLVGIAAAYSLFGGNDSPSQSAAKNAAKSDAAAQKALKEAFPPNDSSSSSVKGATNASDEQGSNPNRSGANNSNAQGGSTPTTTKRNTADPSSRPSATTARGGGGSVTTLPGNTPITAPPPILPNTPEAAYVAGFDARCREVWKHAGADGELWDALDDFYGPFTINDCLEGRNVGWEQGFDTVAEARAAGTDDANWIIEELTPNNRLKNADGFILNL